jgi:glycosyltransferase domain-containing protein
MAWDDLTMIMMTGNRPRMFRDAIDLYAQTAAGLQILVADFSDPESAQENAQTARRNAATVTYFPFPPDTPWQERYRFLTARCTTPFVVMAADDDFLIPDGIAACTAFMRAHPDYSACHGLYYQVLPTAQADMLQVGIDGASVGRSHESPDPIGRLMSLLYWYQSIFYTVQRRSDLGRAELPASVQSGVLKELFTASATAIFGKIARLTTPYVLRNHAPATGAAARTKLYDLYHLSDVVMLGGNDFLEEYMPVRTGLVELLAAEHGRERNWGRLIDTAFASHFRRNWHESRVWSRLVDQGELSAADMATLSAPGFESQQFAVPGEYLGQFIRPLAGNGWPHVG